MIRQPTSLGTNGRFFAFFYSFPLFFFPCCYCQVFLLVIETPSSPAKVPIWVYQIKIFLYYEAISLKLNLYHPLATLKIMPSLGSLFGFPFSSRLYFIHFQIIVNAENVSVTLESMKAMSNNKNYSVPHLFGL